MILKRSNELKSFNKLFSLKPETDDGLSSCSNFPERPSSFELEFDKPLLPEIEHLKRKIGEGNFESLRAVLNRNADVFPNKRRIWVVTILTNTKSCEKKAAFPTGSVQGA